MSRQAIAAALARDDLTAGERLVAFSLASFADRDARARPGTPAAAGRAGLKRSWFLEAREGLERRGLVVVQQEASGRGRASALWLAFARALRSDGLSTVLGGILNSFPYTCFAENVGLVRLTRVRSRFVIATAGVFMIVLGLLPKVAAIVSAIPSPVLGGAALVMFGTVAAVGIQTLSRVDFHDDRNVLIVAVSLGLAMIPVAFPSFYHRFGSDVQTIVGSGITMGAFSAIALNLVMNILGGQRKAVGEVEPTGELLHPLTMDEVNQLSEAEFVEKFGQLFQGPPCVAEEVVRLRPFDSLYAMRHAMHNVLFEAPAERKEELIRAYPDLAAKVALVQVSRRDQAAAGLNRLGPEDYERFDELNTAYRERFGFPFIVCVRENTKDTILSAFERRLENTPTQERMAALVEIAKIANLRLLDLVSEREDERATPAFVSPVGV